MTTPNYNYWYAALEGKRPAAPGGAQPGFYRDRSTRGVAIWLDEKGDKELGWEVTSGYRPKDADQLEELFAFVCQTPITHEVYKAYRATGKWPEDVEEKPVNLEQVAKDEAARVEALKIEEKPAAAATMVAEADPAAGGEERDRPRGKTMAEAHAERRPKRDDDQRAENPKAVIGDNSEPMEIPAVVPEHAVIRARVDQIGKDIAEYLKSINGTITTQLHADKIGNWKDLLLTIKGEAETKHKEAKAPILAAGREIDGAWKPVIDLADAMKRRAAGYVEPFLKAERDRLRAEEEERRRAARVEPEGGAAPQAAPVKVSAGTRSKTVLRKYKDVEIDDLPALAAYLAANVGGEGSDFRNTCKTVARKLLENGIAVPGARLEEKERAV